MALDESSRLKVKLQSSLRGGSLVAFNVTPDVVETRNVNYKSLDPVHMPGGFQIFSNTASRTYAINNIRLVSRTSEEATKNLWIINRLRHWTTPYFGKSTFSSPFSKGAGTEDIGNLGAPPDVLFLSAYSDGDQRGNIYRVPVVITNLSIPYPSDTDYVPTAKHGPGISKKYKDVDENVPFPTIMTIDITCTETHSPREYSNFDIYAYRAGKMDNF